MGVSFNKVLSGSQAFYDQPDYVKTTRTELSSLQAPPPCYEVTIESRISRIAKVILAILFFPFGLWYLLHKAAGYLVVPASMDSTIKNVSILDREYLDLEGPWKYKRLSVAVDDFVVDACLIGRKETLGNGRFVLKGFGNGESYRLHDYDFEQFLTLTDGNALVFNIPGVGASTGGVSRGTMAKAYRAMLQFLEDQEKGLGAREIVGWGYSISGAVQAAGLLEHELKEDINYVFIKEKTFACLGDIVKDLMGNFLGFTVKVLGWNIPVIDSSIQLKAKEIIIQTAAVDRDRLIDSPELIRDDGIIPASSSLAKELLERNQGANEKIVIGTPTRHNEPLVDIALLAGEVKRMLSHS